MYNNRCKVKEKTKKPERQMVIIMFVKDGILNFEHKRAYVKIIYKGGYEHYSIVDDLKAFVEEVANDPKTDVKEIVVL